MDTQIKLNAGVSIHALVRVRLWAVLAHPRDQKVSIHALVRVRPARGQRPRGKYRFNPRTRESATGQTLHNKTITIGFNPRTRESATIMRTYIEKLGKVSIHALVRVRLYENI